jgi:hypothetical protein
MTLPVIGDTTMTRWFVTDMDRENVITHTSYNDARWEAVCRIGNMTPKRNKSGFYDCMKINNDECRECYIIREGTKNTGFDDLWKDTL